MTRKIKIGDLVTNKFEGPNGKAFGLILRVPYLHHVSVLTTSDSDPLDEVEVFVLWSSLGSRAWERVSSLEVVNGTR